MFRGKTFEFGLTAICYRILIEGLKSPVTMAAYSYALSKWMNYAKIKNPDDLLQYKDSPKFIRNRIIDPKVNKKRGDMFVILLYKL